MAIGHVQRCVTALVLMHDPLHRAEVQLFSQGRVPLVEKELDFAGRSNVLGADCLVRVHPAGERSLANRENQRQAQTPTEGNKYSEAD